LPRLGGCSRLFSTRSRRRKSSPFPMCKHAAVTRFYVIINEFESCVTQTNFQVTFYNLVVRIVVL
jgi:hypothetical protein